MSGKKDIDKELSSLKKTKESLPNISRDLYIKEITEQSLLQDLFIEKKKKLNPMNYGLPDILFPKNYSPGILNDEGEVDRDRHSHREGDYRYRLRRKEAVKDLVENYLYAKNSGRVIDIKLLDQQLEFLTDVFYEYSKKAIVWKCCHPDNYVITKNNIKKIKDVKVGDEVINEKGEFVKVKKVGIRVHSGYITKIKPSGFNRFLKFTNDHKILSFNSIKKDEDWIEACEVKKNSMLCFPKVDISGSRRSQIILSDSGKNQKIKFKKGLFRFLGYYLSNGYNYVDKGRVCISIDKDKSYIVEDYIDIVTNIFERKPRLKSTKNVHVVSFNHKNFCKWINENINEIISFLYKRPKSYLREFVVGYYRIRCEDNGKIIKFNFDSDSQASLFYILLHTLCLKPYLFYTYTKNNKSNFSITIPSTNFVSVNSSTKICFRDAIPPSSQCKYSGIENSSEKLYMKCRNVINSFYEGEVYDIEVGGEYESFLSPSLTVHNCRGGGGSLAVAILIWMILVYKQQSVVNVAGSKKQGENVYKYVKSFWDCFPDLKKNLIVGDPLMSLTTLREDTTLEVLPASDKAVRGIHPQVLIIDEAAQEDMSRDKIFRTVINAVLTHENCSIILLSTFHVPVGFFQEHWDYAKRKNFKRYKWTVFDAMKKCDVGLEFATKDDPLALDYCRTRCPLTEEKDLLDEYGNVIGIEYTGCDGKARNSKGFMTRESVIETKMANDGDETWKVEFECNRPQFSGPIFGVGNIEDSLSSSIPMTKDGQGIVGIDWGYYTAGAIVLIKDFGDYVGVMDGYVLSYKTLDQWKDILQRWQEKYSQEKLLVYADYSHPFNNNELEQCGYQVTQVHFSVELRHLMENNLLRYFSYKKIKINDKLDSVIDQLKKYRRNPKTGKPVKEDDHAPDALEAAFAHFDFMNKYSDFIQQNMKRKVMKYRLKEGSNKNNTIDLSEDQDKNDFDTLTF